VGAPERDASRVLVELRSVSQRFGTRVALDGLDASILSGEVLGLLGPNGAGKTTVINIAAGLSRPSGGEVRWEDKPVRQPFPGTVRRRIGLVSQETALYEELTATENLRFAADLYGVERRDERIAEVLALVGLAERAKDRARTLSGGMQRRLALARALIHDPELLILDEPTLGVDIDARHAIWGHIRLLRRQGKTILLSTNYLDEAEALCDRVVALREGRRIAEGTPPQLLSRIGRLVEIDVHDGETSAVRRHIEAFAGIEGIDESQMGLTVRLAGETTPDAVAAAALTTGGVQSVRVRAPDMVEVFESLVRSGDG